MRFPIQIVAKNRTPEEHHEYFRWMRFVDGHDEYGFTKYKYVGWRSRWFLSFMDLLPTAIWRHLPVSWQSYHLFGDPLEDAE